MKKFIAILVSLILVLAGGATLLGVGAYKLSKNKEEATHYEDNAEFGAGAGWYSSENYVKSTEHVNSYFDEEYLYHDQASVFMSPLEPTADDNVVLRLKVRRGSLRSANIRFAFDVSGTKTTEFYNAPMVFEKADVTGNYDFWVGTIPKNKAYYRYHFELTNDRETVYYDRQGISEDAPTTTQGNWYVCPDFTTPEWSKGALWYSIMPESFENSDTLNDKTGAGWVTAWGNANSWAGEWLGGDLSGIINRKEYLKELCISSVFVNPIWVTAHNAGYGSYDFFQVDSSLGSNEVFAEVVGSLHEDELKIMLDAVFEYCNVNNVVYNISKMYPDLSGKEYYDFVQHYQDGKEIYSYWGSPLIDFSSKLTREYLYTEEESVMLTYILKYGIDAWRMDVGNTLSGSNANYFGTATAILKDIRKYIKEISDDILYLSEHADEDQMIGNVLDSKWNYAFNTPLADWALGNSNANVLAASIEDAVLGYPRSVSNSSYNFLTTHDQVRLYDKLGYDDDRFNSAMLVMMTFVGSPCIYFGEEVGLRGQSTATAGTELSFFTSMNWNESEWNYGIYNRTRALAELRREYSDCFTSGAYMNLYSDGLDNPDGVYAFARFDRKTAITAVGTSGEEVTGFKLDVRKLGLIDGTVLTDYMTGRTYKVSKGAVTVDISANGSVFVTGGVGNYADEFTRTVVGEGKGSAVKNADGTFILTGEGTVTDCYMLGTRAFNNTAVTFAPAEHSGKTLYRLAGDGKMYGVVRDGSSLQLVYCDSAGGGTKYGSTATAAVAASVTLAREDDGVCKVYIDGSECVDMRMSLTLGENVTADAAQLGGKCVLGITLSAQAPQKSTAFTGGLGSLFTVYGDSSRVSTGESGLKLTGGENAVAVMSHAPMLDFTVLSSFTVNPASGYAGIAVGRENDYILFGKYKAADGVKTVLAQVVNGGVAVYFAENTTDGKSTYLLQKTGVSYTALISSDGGKTFRRLGVIDANYSQIYAGLINASDAELTAANWQYGDGEQYSAHYSDSDIDFGFDAYRASDVSKQYGVSRSGTYKYVQGGISQTDAGATKSLYTMTGGKMTDLRAAYTVEIGDCIQANSYVGFTFGMSSEFAGDGYTVRLKANGTLGLYSPAYELLASGKCDLGKDKTCLMYVLVNSGNVFVYTGAKPALALSYRGLTEYNGFAGFICNKATYSLYDYGVFAANGNWSVLDGAVNLYANEFDSALPDIELSGANSFNYITMTREGVGDFVMSMNLQIMRINAVMRGYFDINIGVKSGASHTYGLKLRIDNGGRLSVIDGGETKVQNVSSGVTDTSSFYYMISYQSRVLKVYTANYSESGGTSPELKLTYNDVKSRSGTLSFCSQNASARMNALRGRGLSDGLEAQEWEHFGTMLMSEPMPPEPDLVQGNATADYANDFSAKKSLGDFMRYSGATSWADGKVELNGYSPMNWDAGIALANGKYPSFSLSVKIKITQYMPGGGFAGVEFYKSAPTVNHQASALTVVVYASGEAALFVGNGTLTGIKTTGTADSDGFFTLNLTVSGGTVTFDLGGNSVSTQISALPNNSRLSNGYISLNAGAASVVFDDLAITLI